MKMPYLFIKKIQLFKVFIFFKVLLFFIIYNSVFFQVEFALAFDNGLPGMLDVQTLQSGQAALEVNGFSILTLNYGLQDNVNVGISTQIYSLLFNKPLFFLQGHLKYSLFQDTNWHTVLTPYIGILSDGGDILKITKGFSLNTNLLNSESISLNHFLVYFNLDALQDGKINYLVSTDQMNFLFNGFLFKYSPSQSNWMWDFALLYPIIMNYNTNNTLFYMKRSLISYTEFFYRIILSYQFNENHFLEIGTILLPSSFSGIIRNNAYENKISIPFFSYTYKS